MSPLRTYPGRLLAAALASSLFMLLSSGYLAWYLYREQYQTAEMLSENIGSRGAAINLEATVNNLISLQMSGVNSVEPLHQQVRLDLGEIERFADKEFEQELFRVLQRSVETYLGMFESNASSGEERALYLRTTTLPALQMLRQTNGQELRRSEAGHRRALRRMAWGLILVGALGSTAGLVLGYGLARSLRRAVQQFLISVRGASELLSQQIPVVEVETHGEPLKDGSEGLVRQVAQAVERLNAQEREVRRAERLAAVGQLAAGMAHEIRNPLTSAILLLQTGRKDPSAGGLNAEDLLLIEEELLRIELSLRTFLDFARPPKLERRAADLLAVIREALAVARGRLSQASVEVAVQCPEPTAPLQADPSQLGQVLLNLLLNAIDAMPTGGRMRIELERDPPAGGWLLRVIDAGAGIDPAMVPRLFQPFSTGKETGTGLGLVICKRIVEEHGGSIRGYNRPGGGACFEIRLPATAPAA